MFGCEAYAITLNCQALEVALFFGSGEVRKTVRNRATYLRKVRRKNANKEAT
jgi:hypothetical protein